MVKNKATSHDHLFLFDPHFLAINSLSAPLPTLGKLVQRFKGLMDPGRVVLMGRGGVIVYIYTHKITIIL